MKFSQHVNFTILRFAYVATPCVFEWDTLSLCQCYSTCPLIWSNNLIKNVQINRNASDYINSNKKDVLSVYKAQFVVHARIQVTFFTGQLTSLSVYVKYSFRQTPKRKCCLLVSRLMLFTCLRKCLDTDQQAVAPLFHWKHPLFRLFPILSKLKPFLSCWWKSYTILTTKLHGLV